MNPQYLVVGRFGQVLGVYDSSAQAEAVRDFALAHGFGGVRVVVHEVEHPGEQLDLGLWGVD